MPETDKSGASPVSLKKAGDAEMHRWHRLSQTISAKLLVLLIGALVAMEHYGTAITLAALNLFTLRALLPLKEWLDRKGSKSDLGDG